jgi:hypothetical protein
MVAGRALDPVPTSAYPQPGRVRRKEKRKISLKGEEAEARRVQLHEQQPITRPFEESLLSEVSDFT